MAELSQDERDERRRWICAEHALNTAKMLGITITPHRWRNEFSVDCPRGMAPEIQRQFEAELGKYHHEICELLKG